MYVLVIVTLGLKRQGCKQNTSLCCTKEEERQFLLPQDSKACFLFCHMS